MLTYLIFSQYQEPHDGWFPFRVNFPDSQINYLHIGQYVLDPPAGKYGRVVRIGNHLYFANTGKRARFYGDVLALTGSLPPETMAHTIAATIAKNGYNIIRIHHLDRHITTSNRSDSLNPAQLNRLDKLTSELKKRGIYYFFDMLDNKRFRPNDGIPAWDTLNVVTAPNYYPQRPALVTMFYEPATRLLKTYLWNLLTNTNPYTNIKYKDDPAVVALMVVNEGSLIDHQFWRNWSNPNNTNYYLPKFYRDYLDTLWNRFLISKYGNTTNLVNAWACNV